MTGGPSQAAGASVRRTTPFPVPAHRTGRADFPHPALGSGSSRRHSRVRKHTGRADDPHPVIDVSGGVSALPTTTHPVFVDLAWPSGIAFVAASGSSRALLGSPPIASIPCRSVRILKPGPLPSTGITRFHRYYEPLRHPPKPTTHGGCWVKPIPHSGELPVLPVAPNWHAVTPHPGEADRFCRPFATDLCQPSPTPGRVGLRVVSFGAASVFTRVTACQLADNPKLPPFSQASIASLPPRPLG